MSYPKQIVSIYNYPEHLNPFYEDDQHKRLRFWKISSKKKQENGMGSRRGSFNLGSLRDLFSPFSLKKRSSTQGVNKTSESPPPLRRDLLSDNNADEEFKYLSYDPHFRGFQRNAEYRSSLQNMNDFNLANRNSQLRSTIQFGNPRYGSARYGTSITPQPTTRKFSHNGMTPGSSMNSVNSTNPFDDEYDADSMTIASGSSAFNDHPRQPRKKRRAPLPPVNSPQTVSEGVELRIDENEELEKGLRELTRMTAEFESFVRSSESEGGTHNKNNGEVRMVENRTEIDREHDINSDNVDEKPPRPDQIHRKPSLEMQLRREEAAVEQELVTVGNQTTTVTVDQPRIEESHITEVKNVVEVHHEPEIVKETQIVKTQKHRPVSPVIVKVVDLNIQESVDESVKEPEVQPELVFEKCHLQTHQDPEVLELTPSTSREMQLRREEAAIEQELVTVVNQTTTVTVDQPRIEESHITEVKNVVEVHHEPEIVKETQIVKTQRHRPVSPVIVRVIDLNIQESVDESVKEPEVQPELVFEKCHLQTYQDPEVLELTPSTSREMTPDYIPIPVREKFHVRKIDERKLKIHENVLNIEESDFKDESVDQKVLKIDENEVEHEPIVVKHELIEVRKEQIKSKYEPIEKQHEPTVENRVPIEGNHGQIVENQVYTEEKLEKIEKRLDKVEENHFQVEEKHEPVVLRSQENPETSQNQQPQPPIPPIRETKERFLLVKKTNGTVQTGAAAKHVREETPAPMAVTEIDEKLKMQGFIRVANEKPIQYYEDIETVVRKKYSLQISESDNDDEAPKPPQRRRSVKDIIESINRNQQLLGVNRISLPNDEKPIPPSKANVLLKLQRQSENEQRLIADLESFDKENPRIQRLAEFPNDFSVEGNELKINPVPKPRRSLPTHS